MWCVSVVKCEKFDLTDSKWQSFKLFITYHNASESVIKHNSSLNLIFDYLKESIMLLQLSKKKKW